MNKNQLVHTIGERLAADIGARNPRWTSIVLACQIDDHQSGMNGFAYFRDGTHQSVAPKDFDILDMLGELRNSIAASDGKPPWSAALLRLDRRPLALKMEFEYDEPERWQISFANSEQRAAEFRPKPSTKKLTGATRRRTTQTTSRRRRRV